MSLNFHNNLRKEIKRKKDEYNTPIELAKDFYPSPIY